jgi:preprotein translocase subunit SecA
MVYKTEEEKFKAIAREVKQRNQKGQPVLIGTVSIAKNEMLAEHLRREGVQFEILNAKNHEREAHIISQAGRYKAVTLATNIAGRGVDILLGGNPVDPDEAEKVRDAGGLHVLGTERHESRRIDNQLRGRSGRQGDPGSSQFFVSMEDDLMRLFGGDRMKNMMGTLGIADDQPIESKIVSRSIEQAQKKIEGLNFDTRKHVLEFDDVLNHQRNIIYKRRRKYLAGLPEAEGINLKDEILDLIKQEISNIVSYNFSAQEKQEDAIKEIFETVNTIFPVTEGTKNKVLEETQNAADREFAISDALTQEAEKLWEQKEQEFTPEVFEQAQRFIALQSVDQLWMEHLDTMDHLRDSVRLRGYGQRDPLVEYKKEGFQLFQRLVDSIGKQIVYSIFKISVQVQQHDDHVHSNLVTNLSDGSSPASSPAPGQTTETGERIGRNDPCNCGSGKKWKRCGLLQTEEHKNNLAKMQG